MIDMTESDESDLEDLQAALHESLNAIRCVRRSCLFDDTIAHFRRDSLDLAKPFHVRFSSEPAAETGGPKRELFSLVPRRTSVKI